MNLDRISVFTTVAKLQSFSAAARKLGHSPAAVSKQVQLLESELGIKLLHRTTRQVTLTEAGQAFFLRANSAITDLAEAIELAGEDQHIPRGTLRVSVPVTYGHMFLLPLLASFACKYPDVILETSFDDRLTDPLAEGYDIVIRIGPLHDSTLIMKPLGLSPLLLVAAPTYLAAHGSLKTIHDLKAHRRYLGYAYHGGAFEWNYQSTHGTTGTFRTEPTFRTNSAELMLEACLQGLGITLLPRFMLENQLKSNTLVRILPDYATTSLRQIVALTPPTRHRTAKVQAFWNHLNLLAKNT